MRLTRLGRRAAALVLAAAVSAPAAQAALVPAPAAEIDEALVAAMEKTPAKVGVIAQFESAPTPDDVRAMRLAGFLPGMIRYAVVDAVYGEAPAAAVRRLARNPRVTLLEHDAVIPWSLDRANAVSRTKPVWDATYQLNGETKTGGFTGRGVGIAIVDGGVDARHPDLLWKPLADAQGKQAKTIANYKVEGRDSAEIHDLPDVAGTQWSDVVEANMLAVDVPNNDQTGGHGTHVAGIAAGLGVGDARFKGAAPGADIIGYGAGEVLLVHMGLAAFDHIHQHHERLGIRVVNNSWGGPGEWDPDRAVTKAARRLVNEDGLVVVFAAGNDYGDGTTLNTSVWGNIPEVIQVANYYDRTGWLDDSSSRGLKTREDTWPDVAAAGTQIISAAAMGGPVTYVGTGQDALINELDGGKELYVVSAPIGTDVQTPAVAGRRFMVGDYASFTGTSMAAPFVAGVAALILEANPALTPFQVRDILRSTANMPNNRTYAADGYAIGRGVVDSAEAVAVALRMREGKTLTEAIASASFTKGQPAKLNLGTAPVTDNVVPLQPAAPPAVTGNPLMFHMSRVNPGGLTDTYAFVPGELVGLEVRGVQSNNTAEAPISETNIAARLEIRKDGVLVYGPFDPVIGQGETATGDSLGLTYDAEWTIPEDAPLGHYTFESVTTVPSTGRSYRSSVLSFSIGPPPVG